jgi:hypothetical protein
MRHEPSERALELLQREQAPGMLKTIDLLERCGIMHPTRADEWRQAVRVRFAELSAPLATA